MLCEKMHRRNKEIQEQLTQIKKELKTLPKGSFFCSRNGGHFKWYKTSGQTKEYIPKRNRALAEKLAYKRYLECKAEDLKKEQKANAAYLRLFPKETAPTLLLHPGYQELLNPQFKSFTEELAIWQNASYEKNKKYPEQLIHQAASGICVRSKSEMLIDMALCVNQIPFRYECALELNDITYYPDFTIRHPKTGELYYWEHFGMVDSPSYVQSMCQKINTYTLHGIIPSVNLIMTFESKSHPLQSNKINSIIKEYFL